MTTTNKRITLTAAVLVLAALPAFAQQSSQIRETTAEEPQPVAAAEGQALTEQQTGASKFADRIAAVLIDRTRESILRLNYETPEAEKIMGIEYYQAVLRDGVGTYAEFEAWRAANHVTGILEWMP